MSFDIRRPWIASLFLSLAFLGISCRQGADRDSADDVNVELDLRPDPPKVGDVAAVVRLADREARPVHGATVKLEGNMNHSGMKPSFADAKETEPGRYETTLDFTMGGDWFVLVNATLADGRKLRRKIDVPGVRSR
jgi:hypothetical protein